VIVKGVDLSSLSPQFEGHVQGRTLILDGDGLCYRVAATVKRLDTAIRHYQQGVLTLLFLTRSQNATVHLTSKDSYKNGRFLLRTAKPYQGNRSGKQKPPLLEPLREAITLRENWLDEFTVVLHRELEADDGMIIEAHELREHGLIYSEDKDLRMTPWPYWDIESGKHYDSAHFGWLHPKFTPSGTLKLIGQGRKFFWAQMLMGDTADNIQGVKRYMGKLCGPAAAFNALGKIECEHACANHVLDAYRAIGQNPLPEGHALWLLRCRTDSFQQYLRELVLTDENATFIAACAAEVWHDMEASDA